MVGITFLVLAIVDLDVAAVTLRYPGSMTGIALQRVAVLLDLRHRDHGIRALPGVGFSQCLEQRHLEIDACRRMHENIVPVFHDIAEGISARRQQVTILPVIVRRKCHCLGQCTARQATLCCCELLAELFGISERQLPRILLGRAMAVLALDLDLRQRGTRDVAVTMHVDGGVAVLAKHASLGVLGAALDLVMQVVRDEKILLGMELWLLVPFLVVGRAVGKLHQPLVSHADPLATVVTGVAGLDGDARVLGMIGLDHGLACRLDAMHHEVAFLALVDGLVLALVDALIAVGDVA